MADSVAIGPLAVSQGLIGPAWRPLRSYDIFLTALSWETRNTTIVETFAAVLPPITLLKFASPDTSMNCLKEANLAKFQSCCNVSDVLALDGSTVLQKNFRAIEGLLRDQSAQMGRPLRLLIDITCLPKAYVMFLVGAGFSRDYVAVMDCLYVAGVYDHSDLAGKVVPVSGNRSLISVGDWRPEQIPYLTATDYIPSTRDLIVTLGGELGMARAFMNRIEPERTRLFFIEEDVPDTRKKMITSEKIALKHLLESSNTSRSNLSLGDIIGVAEQAIAFVKDSRCGGVTGMSLGAKSHALALAIASLSETNLEIISRVPAGYQGIDVLASGKTYFFELSDRFDPCSYIET
jgi:hypothetical protein